MLFFPGLIKVYAESEEGLASYRPVMAGPPPPATTYRPERAAALVGKQKSLTVRNTLTATVSSAITPWYNWILRRARTKLKSKTNDDLINNVFLPVSVFVNKPLRCLITGK